MASVYQYIEVSVNTFTSGGKLHWNFRQATYRGTVG